MPHHHPLDRRADEAGCEQRSTEGTQAVGLLPSGHPWTKGQRPQSRHSHPGGTRSYRQTLTNLGNNLNQLVRHMNTNGSNKNDIAKAMAMVTDIKQLKSNLDKSL